MPKLSRDQPRQDVPSVKSSSGSSRRAALGFLALIVAMIVVHSAWKFLRDDSPTVQPANSSQTDVHTDPHQAPTKKQPEPGRSQPDPVVAETNSVVAPGLGEKRFVALLADAYRRIDPAADGWQTEAFNEASSAQLQQLAKLFKEPIEHSILETLASRDFRCSALQPASLRDVFQDGTLRVQRADTPITSSTNGHPFRGPDGLAAAIEQFRQLYAEGHVTRVKLKPFRIVSDDSRVATRVYFQSVGDSDSGKLQINATWSLQWSDADTRLPKLTAIQVDEYETVLHHGGKGTIFSDCTQSVLGNTQAYSQQFLYSTDHWRARIPRDLGLDVVANHGLAIGDVNGDQLDDMYVCQQGGLPNRLFLQNSDGTLRDFTAEAGVDYLDYCASALLVDFDNDGDRDLVVACEWRILLLSNDGRGRFEFEFGIGSRAQSFSLSAADYDLDGDVDLYACGYNPTASTVRRGAMGEPMPYHDANNGGQNMLLRNDGNWLFTDVTGEVGLDENNSRFSFAASWEDYDNDGDPDLYVANDYGRNNLYQNTDGRFVDVAARLNVEDMSAGMSASWADSNRDGWMDLYVSNMFSAAGNRITYQRQFKATADAEVRRQFQRHARGNTLFLNTGDGQFSDVSEAAAVTMGRWAWGSKFADLNGDGWEDLVVANGFISSQDTGDL